MDEYSIRLSTASSLSCSTAPANRGRASALNGDTPDFGAGDRDFDDTPAIGNSLPAGYWPEHHRIAEFPVLVRTSLVRTSSNYRIPWPGSPGRQLRPCPPALGRAPWPCSLWAAPAFPVFPDRKLFRAQSSPEKPSRQPGPWPRFLCTQSDLEFWRSVSRSLAIALSRQLGCTKRHTHVHQRCTHSGPAIATKETRLGIVVMHMMAAIKDGVEASRD